MASKTKWVFTPRNPAQEELIRAAKVNDLVFSIGPAGTGKTFSAVAIALEYVLSKRVERIIVARPTVGAGENNGYLPGTLEEKLRPYMAPVYDCFTKLSTSEGLPGYVELCSFEHMRGRDFSDTFIIVDEAQNATLGQLELAMTRLGQHSKMIICGDPDQTDLPNSGLSESIECLRSLNKVAVVKFSESDCLRHHLVAQISKALARHKAQKNICKNMPSPARESANTFIRADLETYSSAPLVKPGSNGMDLLYD